MSGPKSVANIFAGSCAFALRRERKRTAGKLCRQTPIVGKESFGMAHCEGSFSGSRPGRNILTSEKFTNFFCKDSELVLEIEFLNNSIAPGRQKFNCWPMTKMGGNYFLARKNLVAASVEKGRGRTPEGFTTSNAFSQAVRSLEVSIVRFS